MRPWNDPWNETRLLCAQGVGEAQVTGSHRGAAERLVPSNRLCGRRPADGTEPPAQGDGADRKQAEKALTKLQRQVDENKQPKSSITVGQAVAQWLEVADLQPTTQERYDDLIRLYILPTFGHLQAGKLDAELLERLYARLQRCRTLCTGRTRPGHECRPLIASTTRKVHYIRRAALDRAVRWRHLGVNPAAIAQAPAPSKAEPDPPSADEAAAILNEAWRDPEWGLLLWLTTWPGPHVSEPSR